MAQCGYIYASGLRIESGEGTVELDGKTLRVIRNGKGKSRLDRPLTDPPSDGEITLKDLEAELAKSGQTTVAISVGGDHPFSTSLAPASAMGRLGRQGDFRAAFAEMDPEERKNAALYQLYESLPYSDKSARADTQARLAAVLEIVDVTTLTETLPPEFGLFASDEQMKKALASASPTDALRFARPAALGQLAAAAASPQGMADYEDAKSRLTEEEFAELLRNNPAMAQRYESDRLLEQTLANHRIAEVAQIKEDLADMGRRSRYYLATELELAPAVLTALAADKVVVVRAQVAVHPRTPPAVLDQLAKDKKSMVRASAAMNPSTPLPTLTMLALDEKTDPRAGAAINPALPLPQLVLLAQDRKAVVREAAAMNTSASPEILTQLASDDEDTVRARVAQNTNSPAELLSGLALDADETVRLFVAGNPGTPVADLMRLAHDKSDDVRLALVKSSTIPPEVIKEIAENPEFYGPTEALLKADGDEQDDKLRNSREAAIEHPSLPLETLEKLSTDENAKVRGMVARNKSTSRAALERLSADEDYRIRAEVGRNTSTPPAVLDRLASSKEYVVVELVAANPSTHPTTLERLSMGRDRAIFKTDILRNVAANPSTPPAAVARINGSTETE
jgi:hypothetical protein